MSSAELIESTMSEVCTLVTDGTHDTPRALTAGYPLIKAKEIVGGQIDFEGCAFISREEHQRVISRSKPEKGDTLFAHIGASLGEAAYVSTRREFSIKNIALFKPDPTIINGQYLYYLVISPPFQSLAKSTRTGSAQPFLSLGHLRRHRIRFHADTTIQARVAAILSAYDDLIENNLRRITILEEMAQALYREWFVKIRFPGHEKVRMVRSSLGRIPERWSVTTVRDAFEILGGGTPSKKICEYWQGDIKWYAPSDLTASRSMFMDQSSRKITNLGLRKSSARLFPAFSVMMTSRATLGVISINTTEACTNQGFISCIPNDRFPLFMLYHWLKENVEIFISLGTGATFKEITKGVFKTIELALPSEDLLRSFERAVEPIGGEALNLQRKNAILRQTRDVLLPKLISGELDVSNLDIAIPEETA